MLLCCVKTLFVTVHGLVVEHAAHMYLSTIGECQGNLGVRVAQVTAREFQEFRDEPSHDTNERLFGRDNCYCMTLKEGRVRLPGTTDVRDR